MNDGISFDDPPRVAPTVLCGCAVHTLWRGEIQGVEFTEGDDAHCIQWLVMPAPAWDMLPQLNLDKYPEYASQQPDTARFVIGGLEL